MPKIVDHDAYRENIVNRAVEVFRARGYAGIGMREMARELGMSKSALYHYFPSKDALFLACTARVAEIKPDLSLPPIEAIVRLSREWEESFAGELRIILDYIGERTESDLRDDEALSMSLAGFEQGLAPLVGRERIPKVLSAVFGFLLLRYFTGHTAAWEELEDLLASILAHER